MLCCALRHPRSVECDVELAILTLVWSLNPRHTSWRVCRLITSRADHFASASLHVSSRLLPGSSTELSRGTVPYQAPEADSQPSVESLTTAVDIYSLGVVLYEMVTDYDLTVKAKEWQSPPPDRNFPILTNLCQDMRALKPYQRPTAEALLKRPQVAERAAQRMEGVLAKWTPPAESAFPFPAGLSAEQCNLVTAGGGEAGARRSPSTRAAQSPTMVARNLFN